MIVLAVFIGNGIWINRGRTTQQRFQAPQWTIERDGDHVRLISDKEIITTNAPVVLFEEEPMEATTHQSVAAAETFTALEAAPPSPETKPEPVAKRDRRGRSR